ncbi:MAG: hypothetical protein IJ061_07475 [Lachnospiraceae bacterium]|nr:hypothetical protein [Lachnospiraceae bacterium]
MKKRIWMIMLMALVMLAAVPMTSMAVKEGGSTAKKATPSDYVDDEEDNEYDPDEDLEVYVEPDIDTSADEKVVVSEAGDKKEEDGEASEKEGEAAEKEAAEKETEAVKETEKAKEEVKKEPVKAEELTGKWTIDGVTDLKFQKDGSGALVVPSKEFAFDWKLEEESLSISFKDSGVRDVVYTVTRDDNGKLWITEGDLTIQLK